MAIKDIPKKISTITNPVKPTPPKEPTKQIPLPFPRYYVFNGSKTEYILDIRDYGKVILVPGQKTEIGNLDVASKLVYDMNILTKSDMFKLIMG